MRLETLSIAGTRRNTDCFICAQVSRGSIRALEIVPTPDMIKKPDQNAVSYTASTKNKQADDKPNEDCVLANDPGGIYVVADGVTWLLREHVPYPCPSGGQIAARTVCETIFRILSVAMLERRGDIALLRYAIDCANAELASLNRNRRDNLDLVYEDFFSAVVTASLVRNSKLVYGHIGDCILAKIDRSGLSIFTEQQTAAVSQFCKRARSKMAYEELVRTVHAKFRNRLDIDDLGNTIGYGVLTGEPTALNFLRCGSVNVDPGSTFVLVTDGCQTLMQERPDEFRRLLGDTRYWPTDVNYLIELASDLEEQKNIRSDDKSIVVFRLGAD